MSNIDELVNRFLTWPVPADVYPDGMPGQPGRTGTNLLTAGQAKQMLTHVLAGDSDTEAMRDRLKQALFVLGMVDKNNRIAAGERGKAWSGRFVSDEVRRVLGGTPAAFDGSYELTGCAASPAVQGGEQSSNLPAEVSAPSHVLVDAAASDAWRRLALKARGELKVLAWWMVEVIPVLRTLDPDDSEDGGECMRVLTDRGGELVSAVFRELMD